ncbi:hypothetical protein ACFL4F_02570 [Candidatus Margulisiibacteriota bacterium]
MAPSEGDLDNIAGSDEPARYVLQPDIAKTDSNIKNKTYIE